MMDNGTALVRLDDQPRFTEVEVLEPEEPGAGLAGRSWGAAQAFAQMVGQAVVAATAGPKLSDAEEQREWARAFDEWLHTDPKTGDPRPAATTAAYGTAWADLRTFTQKEARFISGLDIRDWVNDLRSRPIDSTVAGGLIRNGRRQPGQVGLSAATVGQYLAAISSFFTYCQNYEARAADGRIVVLFDQLNPAKSHAVKRPKTKRFGSDVTWLDDKQLKALREAIRSASTLADLERGVVTRSQTVVELRDYALYTSYILTGARNSEVRKWQWQDIKQQGGRTFYSWANKGKSGTDELPGPCWQALQDYLRLSGRLETMGPEDYIFQPVGDAITRMKRADGTAVVEPGQWDPNRPLSPQSVNSHLRSYCKRAGIDDARIHVHSLRHSANMLYDVAGASLEARSRMLHHSSLDMTGRYSHEMAGQKNADWNRAADLLGL
jgi:integrase